MIETKYDFLVSDESVEKNILRLINQMWKLIPMKENEEDWEKQLQTVILQVVGFAEIFNQDPKYLELLAKLEGLRISKVDFQIYRKSVFESISLLQGIKNDRCK